MCYFNSTVVIVSEIPKMTDETTSRISQIFKRGSNYFSISRLRDQVGRFFYNLDAEDIKEQKINIHGFDINYCRVGSGELPVLLLPGCLGSISTNFNHQLKSLDRKKMTIVCWDAPGYGKSIPPIRNFSDDYFGRDATYAKCLMNALGFETFSMIGWCHGGITALHLAGMYPDAVKKLILIGTPAKILPAEMIEHEESRDVDSWKCKRMSILILTYSETYVRKVWPMWVDRMRETYENQDGEFGADFDKIQCPTLIVHGESDRVIDMKHASMLSERIKNARVCIIKNGSHGVHRQFPEEFSDLATEFLLPA